MERLAETRSYQTPELLVRQDLDARQPRSGEMALQQKLVGQSLCALVRPLNEGHERVFSEPVPVQRQLRRGLPPGPWVRPDAG